MESMEYSLQCVDEVDAEELVRRCEWPSLQGDPWQNVMFPHIDNKEDEEECIAWTIAKRIQTIQYPDTKVPKVCDKDGNPVGFAMWRLEHPPKVKPPHIVAPPANDPSLPKALDVPAWQSVSTLFHEERSRMIGDTPEVWRLSAMFVDPNHQRRGIGAMLMKWGCDIADEKGYESVVMASPSGAKLYQKFGFEIFGRVIIPNGDSYSMKRSPKAIHVDSIITPPVAVAAWDAPPA